MGGNSSVGSLEARVKTAERNLQVVLNNREEAKRVGNYKNASKSFTFYGSKPMNVYDAKVYEAKRELKEAKARLAEAKKRYK